MRRHTLLALSLAAGLALPVGFSTAALAVTDAQRSTLANAAATNQATMQAAIATVLQELAADSPLNVVLDDLAGVLLDLGVTDEFKAEFAVSLVRAAQNLAAAGALPGFDGATAGEAAAESVLVRSQGSPALVSAIMAEATATEAGGAPGGTSGGMVSTAFIAASASPLIDMANRDAVRNAIVRADTGLPQGQTGTPTQFGNGGFGGGPNLGGFTLVGVSTGNSSGGGGTDGSSAGQSISPN
jgi:hypothetical protein